MTTEKERDKNWERLGELMNKSNRKNVRHSTKNVGNSVSEAIDIIDDTISEIEAADEFLELNAKCIRDELEASEEYIKNIDPKTFEQRKREMREGFEDFFRRHPEEDTVIKYPYPIE